MPDKREGESLSSRAVTTFAALRFTEDENLADRTYWYACPSECREGDCVLAPVGAHNRLQAARIERILTVDEAHAPYDVRLIKRVEAKCGARKLTAGRLSCYELGGVKYDGKRYTFFHRVVCSPFEGELSEEERAILIGYGVRRFLPVRAGEEEGVLSRIVEMQVCTLVYGGGAENVARRLLKGARERDALFGVLCR